MQSFTELAEDTLNKNLLLNVEYRVNGFPHATLLDAADKRDVIKDLIKDGVLLVEGRREKKLVKLVREIIILC